MPDWSSSGPVSSIWSTAGWHAPATKSRASAASSIRSLTATATLPNFSDCWCFYARGDRFFYVVLTAFVMVSAIMVSYTRARAESLIGSCKVGFMERPERLVLIIIGALFNRMAPVLWLIAVLSTITVIHRIRYTWTRTEGVDAAPRKAGQAASETPGRAQP